ncbi:MAG: ribonuclease HII [Pseudomonadota bacterium]|jgi:ribonuclease HII|nr:ribonuclease HII [Pseudomonadota bacterium]|tara:strand:+ start:394 stop:936 length:543 start_codon:yes stop_codon:yes gene_type:complete
MIAGTDEVGRGCLAGPVVAAAVILKEDIPGLTDSKKITPKRREFLADLILEKSFFAYGVVSNNKIDKINILNASLLAMKRAILNLPVRPSLVLVDGTFKPDLDIPMRAIIGGDSSENAISAASIIAKVYRDNLMIKYDSIFPVYDLKGNKGYGTKKHLEALKNFGHCEIHRTTFNGVIIK